MCNVCSGSDTDKRWDYSYDNSVWMDIFVFEQICLMESRQKCNLFDVYLI